MCPVNARAFPVWQYFYFLFFPPSAIPKMVSLISKQCFPLPTRPKLCDTAGKAELPARSWESCLAEKGQQLHYMWQ